MNSNEFIFDIPISEKDLLELLPQKVYNMAGERAVSECILLLHIIVLNNVMQCYVFYARP